jgi:hypothetical protein
MKIKILQNLFTFLLTVVLFVNVKTALAQDSRRQISLLDFTANTDPCGTLINVAGLSKADMQKKSTFTDIPDGWDFTDESTNGNEDIWTICQASNYPRFSWQVTKGDFTCPDGVNSWDFAVFAAAWHSENGDSNWNLNCDISIPPDGVIDEHDLAELAYNWLSGL